MKIQIESSPHCIPTPIGLMMLFLLLTCTANFAFGFQDSDEFSNEISEEDRAQVIRRAKILIRELGDDKYAVRAKAEKELRKIAIAAKEVLEVAAQHDDFEVAERVRLILKSLPKPTHQIVDALGNPIAFSKVQIQTEEVTTAMFVPEAIAPGGGPFPRRIGARPEKPKQVVRKQFARTADANGWVAVPNRQQGSITITFKKSTYGMATWTSSFPLKVKQIQMPLVPKSSKAYTRALKGKIVNSKGRRVVGVQVVCQTIRTPGEGLIQPTRPLRSVLSDDKGEFAIYPPIGKSKTHGNLIPINSNFQIVASLVDSKTVPPTGGTFSNVESAKLVMTTDAMLRRFDFESFADSRPSDKQLHSQFSIYLDKDPQGNRVGTQLNLNSALTGMKLTAGTYSAQRILKGKTIKYEPIVVSEDSPEKIVFKLPPPITYYGRIVNAVTGKPIPDAFVIGFSSTREGALSDLTDRQWEELKSTKSDTAVDAKSLNCISKIYGLEGFTKSDSQGRFELEQPIDRPFYGLIGFDKNKIPVLFRGFNLIDKKTGELVEPEFQLFPAAKVDLETSFPAKDINIWPTWKIVDQDQPNWCNKLITATQSKTLSELHYQRWLKTNQTRSLYVPAGIKLKVRFKPPSNQDSIAPSDSRFVQLKVGETTSSGRIEFKPTLLAKVRITNTRGIAIEGMPVRCMHQGERTWSIVRNTNAEGIVSFGLYPNSKGKFRAGEFNAKVRVRPATMDFETKETPPKAVYDFKLSDEIINANLSG